MRQLKSPVRLAFRTWSMSQTYIGSLKCALKDSDSMFLSCYIAQALWATEMSASGLCGMITAFEPTISPPTADFSGCLLGGWLWTKKPHWQQPPQTQLLEPCCRRNLPFHCSREGMESIEMSIIKAESVMADA